MIETIGAWIVLDSVMAAGTAGILLIGPYLEALIRRYEEGDGEGTESFTTYLKRCLIANSARIVLLTGGVTGAVFAIKAVATGGVGAGFLAGCGVVAIIGGPIMLGIAAAGGIIWSAFNCYNRYYIEHPSHGYPNFIIGQEYTIGIRTYWFFDEGCNWYWLTLPNGRDVSMERFENDTNALHDLFELSTEFDNGATSGVITILGNHITVGVVPAGRRLAKLWYDASDPRRGGRYGTCPDTCIYDTPGWNCYFKFSFIYMGEYTPPPSPSCSPSSLPWSAEGDYCAICLDNHAGRTLQCGHHFHRKCLSCWFEINRTCPNCMRPVP